MLIVPALIIPPAFLLRHHKRWIILAAILAVLIIVVEPYYHVTHTYDFPRPAKSTDPVFFPNCPNPRVEAETTPRQSAALFMLARNSEGDDAAKTVRNLEARFNQYFHYPWVFLNDQPWEDSFKAKVIPSIRNGTRIIFDTIDSKQWTWPDQFGEKQQEAAVSTWERMASGMSEHFRKGTHVDKVSYHHMCRYNSGFFYDHPAMAEFDWYWRVEPGVSFTCDIPYDPFAQMARNNKTYGYTVALWEVGKLSPSLFRASSEYADTIQQKPPLWQAMHEPSWAPWPIRRFLLSPLESRNSGGDKWSMCHFWSNFEIARLDFFRSEGYREYFKYLDKLGGFHYERWGDAPVHSLAAAMFLQPEQVHYFKDIGYLHPPFEHCPTNDTVGCNCECTVDGEKANDYCLNSVRRTVEPDDRPKHSWDGWWKP